MNKEDAIFFAGQMEDFLHIPSFVCEMIEKSLMEEKYKDVLEFIISRRKELETMRIDNLKENLGGNKDEY